MNDNQEERKAFWLDEMDVDPNEIWTRGDGDIAWLYAIPKEYRGDKSRGYHRFYRLYVDIKTRRPFVWQHDPPSPSPSISNASYTTDMEDALMWAQKDNASSFGLE